MKKTFVALAAALLASSLGYGQDFHWPRKKAAEVGIGRSDAGFMAYGAYVYYFQPRKRREKNYSNLIPTTRYVSYPCKKKFQSRIQPGLSAKLSAFYEVGHGKEITYRAMGVDAALLYAMHKSEKLYISLKGGLTLSNDVLLTPINEGGRENNHNSTKYGVLGGGEIDYMLNRRRTRSLVLGWDERFLSKEGNTWGNRRWYAYAGYRFKIGG